MSKSGLLSGSTLASRFPTVARLLGAVGADDTGPQDPPAEDPPADDPPADDPPADDPPADDPPADDPPADNPPSEETAASLAGLDASARMSLMEAFDRDASALVSAERDRCITVFTSDAGKRNPDGAADVLRETNMSGDKASTFLGKFGGNSRTDARNRLNNDSSTRVQTGPGKDSTAGGKSAKDAHRERQAERNKRVKGGKRVGAAAPDTAD